MRWILQLGLMMLMLLGVGNRAWGRASASPAPVEWDCSPSRTFDRGVDAPPRRLASGEAAAWGLDVELAGTGPLDSTPTTAGPVVVTFHGTAFLMCPGAPPPVIGSFRATTPAWMAVGPNVYAYVKQNPWTGFDPHGLSMAGDYFDGVCDVWKGYGDVTVGAVVSAVHAVASLPSNIAGICSMASEASHMDGAILKQAASNRYEGLKGEVSEGVTAYGQRLANGDNRAWGQTIGTALTLGGSKGAQFAKAAEVAEVSTVAEVAEVSSSAAGTAAKAEQVAAETSTAIVPYDPHFAVRQILGDHSPTGHLTPGGRSLTPHAAERMVAPPAGRTPMTKAQVDQVLDKGNVIKKVTPHPEGTTVSVQNTNMPGNPQAVVDAATGKRVITVINPKKSSR